MEATLRASIVRQFGTRQRVCVTPEDTLQGMLTLALVCSGTALRWPMRLRMYHRVGASIPYNKTIIRGVRSTYV